MTTGDGEEKGERVLGAYSGHLHADEVWNPLPSTWPLHLMIVLGMLDAVEAEESSL